MIIDRTYQPDYVSMKIVFHNTIKCIDARELADTIAKTFNVLNPPQLKLKETQSNGIVPEYIDFVIRYESTYEIARFLIQLLNIGEENNQSIL
jgi:hypothetical protein